MVSLVAWIFTFTLSLQILFVASHSNPRRLSRATEKNPGFISIDCGASRDYLDEETGIFYQTDADFIETGTNLLVSSNTIDTSIPDFGRQLHTLRNFPDGNRNCYTLKPKQGKQQSYLIRAMFSYANYDGKNKIPHFDLYIGVNYWTSIGVFSLLEFSEMIHAPTTDIIQVCLINTNSGIPYISSLELRPLSNSIYQITSHSLLRMEGRYDVGASKSIYYRRYKDDIYDRTWRVHDDEDVLNWYNTNTTAYVNTSGNDIYKVPSQVLNTAVHSFNLSSDLYYDYDLVWKGLDRSSKYHVYFHFAEISPGLTRTINITLNNQPILSEPITLEYLKPITISHKNATPGYVRFSIKATAKSDAPPMLNAFEIYKSIQDLNSTTYNKDVEAIVAIKSYYGISRIDWQGDPCVPQDLRWSGLNCSYGMINPRIISLNLSSSQLQGEIAASVSDLTQLKSLDMSNNNLIGLVPESLSQLVSLRILNLEGNKLSGSIPAKLIERSSNGSLTLSVGENQYLCNSTTCRNRKRNKFVTPLVVALVLVFILSTVSLFLFRRLRVTNKNKLISSNTNDYVDSNKKEFTYLEVQRITNNFERFVGRGGFGTVYHGCIGETQVDGWIGETQVAVKMLSPSTQAYQQFQTEAKILTRVHHKCLTPLIGYCNEDNKTALIYEYMTNGDLAKQLSGESQTLLDWKQRFQIALDSAVGLEYLHNGCRPPIVHRDVKTGNILLDENLRAKICDFGLSKIFPNENDTYVSTIIAGTPGYLDPEYYITNRLNEKSDVFSFGVVLLEIITGQAAILKSHDDDDERVHIIEWVSSRMGDDGEIEGIMDERLQGEYDGEVARKIVDVAMACVAQKSVNRPTMNQVVMEFKQCLPVAKLECTSISNDIVTSTGEISGYSSLAR